MAFSISWLVDFAVIKAGIVCCWEGAICKPRDGGTLRRVQLHCQFECISNMVMFRWEPLLTGKVPYSLLEVIVETPEADHRSPISNKKLV